MPRFTVNRWWTLVLALALGVASIASSPSAGYADKGNDGVIGSDPLGSNPPDPQSSGDPDMPSGGGKPSTLVQGGASYYGTTGTSGAGDAGVRVVAPFWERARLTLRALKYYYLRF